jgi:hypothetical protein
MSLVVAWVALACQQEVYDDVWSWVLDSTGLQPVYWLSLLCFVYLDSMEQMFGKNK